MENKRLHIVAFDVPFPANYGGAIDVFYKLKALHQLGIRITLHCFEYGRGEQKELLKYVHHVHYYKRKKTVLDALNKTPFIVKSRATKALLNNLLSDKDPILFEGLHCCYFLDHSRLKDRIKIVRTHNVEHDYYAALARASSGMKKWFHLSEARKLKNYEAVLKNADAILAIKESDADHFKHYSKNVQVLPACAPQIDFIQKQDPKPYFLFHGNLSVKENETGAIWLIERVFSAINRKNKLIIAGKSPSKALIEQCKKAHIQLIPNPTDHELEQLIQEAHAHVFYSNQATGVKLKLINSMASSGHIIVNEKMILGSALGNYCTVVKDEIHFRNSVEQVAKKKLSEADFAARIAFLNERFDALNNCKSILALINSQ